MSDDVFLRQGVESNALLSLSLSVDTLESMNKVSTDNAYTPSAVVKPAEEIDVLAPWPMTSSCESAAVVVSYGMVP